MRARLHQTGLIVSGAGMHYAYQIAREGFPSPVRQAVTVFPGVGTIDYVTTHADSGVILDPAINTVAAIAHLHSTRTRKEPTNG